MLHMNAGMRIRFDRGTLLFEDPENDSKLAELPGIMWDPRVQVYRAPACQYKKIIADFENRGARISDCVPGHSQTPGRFHGIELRPYQDAALDAWDLSGRHALLALPTGSGKTRTALAAISRSGVSAVCLVPTRVLLDQWIREITKFYTGPVGRLGDGDRRVEAVTVSTFESAYRQMPVLGNRFEMIVVDEAHHFGGKVRDEALEMCIAGIRLGLTATPPRDCEAANRLVDLIGPTAYELQIPDLAGSFLADFDMITVSVDLTPEEQRCYDENMAKFRPVFFRFRRIIPTANWTDFVKNASRTKEGRLSLESWRRARKLLAYPKGKADTLERLLTRHRGSKILVFTANNETAYTIALTHLVMPITCNISRAEREEALDRFRKGELRTLVSSRVLNEGVDVPDADIAVIVGGTMGQREHVQRVGRILRPSEGKRALVYELVVRGTGEVPQAYKRRRGLVSR